VSRPPVKAGELRWSATIERRTVARDAATGAEVITWGTLATVRVALKESATANEAQAGGVDTYARPSRVRMWYRADFTTADRLNLGGGRLLQITGLAELGYRQGLELACKEWAHEVTA
jgi:head-tail adaptor